LTPIARELLAPSLNPFGRSITLPAAAYTDWSVFRWEQEHFFQESWICGPLSPREDAVYQLITIVANGYLEGKVSRLASRVTATAG
jgi:hypothetical protein